MNGLGDRHLSLIGVVIPFHVPGGLPRCLSVGLANGQSS